MNVYEKLMAVQRDLKAPKGQFNAFGKYKYRSAEDVLESVKPLLAENKLVLNLTDTVDMVGDRYYIVATAKLVNIEEPSQVIEVQARAREDESKKGQDLSQTTGSTSSYARKYALNGLFLIDDTKDSDATNDHGKGSQPPAPKVSAEKVVAIKNLAEVKGVDVPALLKYYNVTKFDDMNESQWNHGMKVLQSK